MPDQTLAAARRPWSSPARTWAALVCASLAIFLGIELALDATLGVTHAPSLRIALFFVGYDVAVGVVLIIAIAGRLAKEKRAMAHGGLGDSSPPSVSVLVAAYDERECIVETVRALAAQTGVEIEIIVGDDGSTDGTHRRLIDSLGLRAERDGEWCGSISATANDGDGRRVPVRVVRLQHAGKGATLNAIALRAKYSVLITMDADTTPACGALARLAGAFSDVEVDCAAGVVMVRNGRDNWLTHHQSAEYLKNALVRIGWSALGALEQVPGAFAGIRAAAFAEAGGFPTDSLTEDYELTFRLIARGVRSGRAPLVVTVPGAQVFTEAPRTVTGFIRQRTRWFAGFLSTLVRFRWLIFNPRAASFGLVRLPLKIVDAVLPITAFASLIVLVKGGLFGHASLAHAALLLFVLRWIWDLVVYGLAVTAGGALGDVAATAEASPSTVRAWLCTATEAVTYVWLKHAATLRGYVWAVRRVRKWESSRVPEIVPERDAELA